jgi:DNA-binding response OmpR family regulator
MPEQDGYCPEHDIDERVRSTESPALALDLVTDVLLATDSDVLVAEVHAALGDADTTIRLVRAGADVRDAVATQAPDLLVLDLQIGNMGGVATSLDLRLESDMGRLPRVPILLLLDRSADVFLAERSLADRWLIKPLDALSLGQAARDLLREATTEMA